MRQASRLRFRSKIGLGITLIGLIGAGGLAWMTFPREAKGVVPEGLKRVAVRKASVNKTVRAPGRVDSAKKTLIECELENLRLSAGEGNSIRAAGRTTILEIIPDGSTVHGGDVLCRLDSSEYEEMVRQQEIKVLGARSDLMKVGLDLKAAEMTLREYQEGLLPDANQKLEGSLVMAESEVKRQADRMTWAKKMIKFGYLSEGQFLNEEQRMLQAETTLKKLRGERELMNKFQAPIGLMKLEMQVTSARSVQSYYELRKRRVEEQLAKFRKQVEHCTVKAPHDGFVIYANEDDGDARVQLGAEVHKRMDLFYLPDLGAMEIDATLHETLLNRVEVGMMVRARVEALPQYDLEGEVIALAPLPSIRYGVLSDFWIKNYSCRIRLRNAPEGLLPGMTAEVAIEASPMKDALVVPAQAVLADHGKEYCYVTGPNGLERRAVTLGQSSRFMLEIREGLAEGEVVVEDPSVLDEETLSMMMAPPSSSPVDGPRRTLTQ